eukprot:g14379.t1
MPESIFKNVQHLCPEGKQLLDEEIRFGTAANDREDESAPSAKYSVILFFRINDCEQLFQAKFVIVDGGSVASFPLILGLPFMHAYGIDISMKTSPPHLKIGADTFQCAEQPLPMVEITFVDQHQAVDRYPVYKQDSMMLINGFGQGDDASTNADCQSSRDSSSSRESSVHEEAANLYTTPAPPVVWKPRRAVTELQLSVAQMLYSSNEDLLENEAFLEEVDHILREDEPAAAAEPADANEETPADRKERLRKQALRAFMEKERRSLGHSRSAEALFEGEALEVLRQVRASCRLCGMYDDAHAVRTRGSLLQFAVDKNIVWIMDTVPTRIGLLIKVMDACSRLRHAELLDTHPAYGGKVGAAIRCFHAAKRRFAGEPETLVVDLGSDLVSTRFKHIVESVNTKVKVIGFKAAHKISKLEQDNGQTRLHINKLVNPPFEPWLELLLWCYATHSEDQEFFEFDHEDLIKQVSRIRIDANDFPEPTEIKRLIIEEYLWQTNNKPILGACLSAHNFHSGTLARGTRDWEYLFEETLEMGHGSECAADVFMQRATKIQHACRDVVASRDLEMYARRRELVSRMYRRGKKIRCAPGTEALTIADNFPLGTRVYIRRPETSKFHRWVGGEVRGHDEHAQTVLVQRGDAKTIEYNVTDVAVEKPADTGKYVAEFFPDQDLLDLVQDRGGVVVFDDEVDEEEQNSQAVLHVPRRDLFYKLKEGISTHKPKSVGGVQGGHTCEHCDKVFTSRRRLLQHINTTCQECKISTAYREGQRTGVTFSTAPPDTALPPQHEPDRNAPQLKSCLRAESRYSGGEEPSSSEVVELKPRGKDVLAAWDDDDIPGKGTEGAKGVRRKAHLLHGPPSVQVMPLDYPYEFDGGFRQHVKWAQEEDLAEFCWRGRVFAETDEGEWKLRDPTEAPREMDSGVSSYFGDPIFDGDAPAPLGSIASHVVEEVTTSEHLGADGLGPTRFREVETRVETLAEARARRHAARQERLEKLDRSRPKAPKRKAPAPFAGADPVIEIPTSSSSSDFPSSDSAAAPEPSMKKLRTNKSSEFLTYTSARHHDLQDKQKVCLAAGERLFQNGILHEKARKQIDRYKTSVELTVGNGEIFLSSAAETPDSDVTRAYDFTALPIVDKLLRKSTSQVQTFKLLKGPNQVCFPMSQLLNGRCIRGELSAKDCRDVQYVVVEAQVHREKAGGHVDPGRHCNLRFGKNSTPALIDDEEAKRAVADTWVVRMYYEACADSHDAVEAYAAGTKSTSLTLDLEDARRLGFASYAYAACCAEVRAVDGSGVLGKRYKQKELEALGKKNIVTSRWLLTVKIERVSGRFQRIKARWITHGFKDLRYKRGNGQEPNRRSYTIGDAALIALVQYLQALRVPMSLADIKEALLRGMLFTDMYEDIEDQEVFLRIPPAIIEMEIDGVEPLDECVQQVKSLYGNKDAPMGWEKKWWWACKTAGLQQAVSDPSLWLYYANEAERRAMQEGKAKEYYRAKLDEINAIPTTQLEQRVKILEQGSVPLEPERLKAKSNTNVVNPHTLTMYEQVLPHTQRREDPLGAMGMHVDDSISGGLLLFHLPLGTTGA